MLQYLPPKILHDFENEGNYSEANEQAQYVIVVANSVGKLRSQGTEKYTPVNSNRQLANLSNAITINGSLPNSIVQYFEYLEIPLNVRYKLIDGKIDFTLIGGVSSNFLVNNNFLFKERG
ncbi:MAG: hypothetical protein HC906_02045 [Bacteroidales bacterium]|nr:hypothetical protein [Bacteroidales bacterium]